MSMIRTLGAIGAALAGTVGAGRNEVPPVDPAVVRSMLVETGMLASGAADVEVPAALRRFQAGVGLTADGVADHETVRALNRYAMRARHLRELGLAA